MKIMVRLDKQWRRAIQKQNFSLATKIRSEMRARSYWALGYLLKSLPVIGCSRRRLEKATEALDLVAIRNANQAGTTHEALFGDGDNTYGVDLGDLKLL